jgi:hypothetical protein
MKAVFNIGETIKPKGYNEVHTIVNIDNEGYLLDNDFKLPYGYEDIFLLVNSEIR